MQPNDLARSINHFIRIEECKGDANKETTAGYDNAIFMNVIVTIYYEQCLYAGSVLRKRDFILNSNTSTERIYKYVNM